MSPPWFGMSRVLWFSSPPPMVFRRAIAGAVGAAVAVGGVAAAWRSGSAPAASGPSLPFFENQGQWPPDVRFAARGPSGDVWLTDEGPVVAVGAGHFAIRLEDQRRVAPVASGALGAHANYLLGSDPAAWRTG